LSREFIPRILKLTKVTHSSATLIDHILTNDIAARSSPGKIIKAMADHFAVFHISVTNSKHPKPMLSITVHFPRITQPTSGWTELQKRVDGVTTLAKQF